MYKKLSTKIIIILVTAAILTVPSSVLQVSHAQSNADLQNTVLEIVNRERAAVGVPPLVWSDTLAAGAQTWADHQAAIGESVHSPGNFKDYAETIAYRGPSGGTLIPMVESWINEKTLYHGGPMPADGGGFSHYTQVVWGTTTEIGCGMASGVNAEIGSVDYLVCRFLPMGNFVGQLPYGQGAAPAVAEDTGAPPADQAAGDENGCTVLISSQCTGAPPADQGAAAPPADQGAAAPPADQGADGGGNEN